MQCAKVFSPLRQYLAELPKAAGLLEYVCASFAHLETGIFAHSYLQNSWSSVRLEGECLWTSVFRSCHRFPIGFRSGLWLGRSNTWICFVLNHSIAALTLCSFGSIHLSINSDHLPCPCWGEAPPDHGAAPTMFDIGDGVFRVMCSVSFLPHSLFI